MHIYQVAKYFNDMSCAFLKQKQPDLVKNKRKEVKTAANDNHIRFDFTGLL